MTFMNEITFKIERCDESGAYVASWDAPGGEGGITTQGNDLRELETMIQEAVQCHFDNHERPRSIRLHFIHDPILATA